MKGTGDQCRAAQEDGDYAHAFWLCVQSGQAMGSLGTLRCAQTLAENVNALYEETIDRLESTLQACCADFKPDTLGKVRAGHRCNMLHPQIFLQLWYRLQEFGKVSPRRTVL